MEMEKIHQLMGTSVHSWRGGRTRSDSWHFSLHLFRQKPPPQGKDYFLVDEEGMIREPLRELQIDLRVPGFVSDNSLKLHPREGVVLVAWGSLCLPSFRVPGKSLAEIKRQVEIRPCLYKTLLGLKRALYHPVGSQAVYRWSSEQEGWEPLLTHLVGGQLEFEILRDQGEGDYLSIRWDPSRKAMVPRFYRIWSTGMSSSSSTEKKELSQAIPECWVPLGEPLVYV